MKHWQSQAHVKWDCKYHVVILPKYRLSVPPWYSIAMTIGYLKGKSAIRIHRELLHTKGTLFGRSFWARGYCVSIVGLDEDQQVRRYIREQEKHQRDQDQGELNLD